MKLSEIPLFAEKYTKELIAEGEALYPVQGVGKKIATQFWGAAWMRHLAQCEDSGFHLSHGRSLLRHGAVIDLQVMEGQIRAKVAGEYLYDVQLDVSALDEVQLEVLARVCSGELSSLISLLEGNLSEGLIRQLFDPDLGLLPQAMDWKMSCTCEDWAELCCHAAAALYGVGVLLDTEPSKLFLLRGVQMESLLVHEALAEPLPMDHDLLAKTFQIDI